VSDAPPPGSRTLHALSAPARHPWPTLIVACLLALVCLFRLTRMHADPALEKMANQNDASAIALGRVLGHFSAVEDLLILVTLPPDAQQPDPAKLTSFAQNLDRALQSDVKTKALCNPINYQTDPETRQFFEKVLVPSALYYLDDKTLAAARERLTRDEMRKQIAQNEALLAAPGPAADALAKAFLKDPLRLHDFFLERLMSQRPFKTFRGSDAYLSQDGRSLLIRVPGKKPPNDLEFANAITGEVERVANSVNSDQLQVELSGAYAIAARSQQSIRSDMIENVTGSVIFLQILFMLVYRRPIRWFLLSIVTVVLGTLIGFGAFSLISMELTPLTAVIGGVLAGMGIDYSVQYRSHYYALRARGLDAVSAAELTLHELGRALLASWATSIIGFIAICFSAVPALRDFAILGAFGLTGTFLSALFVLPAILGLLERSSGSFKAGNVLPRIPVVPVLNFIASRRRLLFSLMLFLSLAAVIITIGSGGELLPLESNMNAMHPQPNPSIEAQHKIAERMGSSPDSLIVHLRAGSPESLLILAHDVDSRLKSVANRAAGVSSVLGIASLLPDPRVAAHRGQSVSTDEANRILSDFRAAIADSMFDPKAFEPYEGFLKELFREKPAPTLDTLRKYPSLARNFLPGSPAICEAISIVFADHSLDQRAERARTINSIRSVLADVPGATLTGISVLSHDTELTIRHDLPKLLLIAAVVTILYLASHFRSLRDTLLSLIPAVFSMLMLLAVSRLADIRLNMVNLLALPLLVGIDVDYGIYIVTMTREAISHRDTRDRLIGRLASSAHAIVMCAATTIVGFGSLAFTSVPAIRSLGVVTGVGVFSALVATLFLLLPLLIKLSPDVEPRES
jgi:predicted RND superfamily exporter protein